MYTDNKSLRYYVQVQSLSYPNLHMSRILRNVFAHKKALNVQVLIFFFNQDAVQVVVPHL
jgi:hypothetical protein